MEGRYSRCSLSRSPRRQYCCEYSEVSHVYWVNNTVNALYCLQINLWYIILFWQHIHVPPLHPDMNQGQTYFSASIYMYWSPYFSCAIYNEFISNGIISSCFLLVDLAWSLWWFRFALIHLGFRIILLAVR